MPTTTDRTEALLAHLERMRARGMKWIIDFSLETELDGLVDDFACFPRLNHATAFSLRNEDDPKFSHVSRPTLISKRIRELRAA